MDAGMAAYKAAQAPGPKPNQAALNKIYTGAGTCAYQTMPVNSPPAGLFWAHCLDDSDSLPSALSWSCAFCCHQMLVVELAG